MRSLLLFLALFQACTVSFGQTAGLTPRHWYQQQFIIKEFLTEKKAVQIKTRAQMDSFFSEINSAWRHYVADSLTGKTSFSDPVLNNLDAYSYFWAIMSKLKHTIDDPDLETHLYTRYMLPSLIKDYELLNADTTLLGKNLIWAASLGNTFSIGARNYHDTASFNHLYKLAKNLKAFCLSSKDTSRKARDYRSAILTSLGYNKHELESKRYFITGEPDISFTHLVTGLTAGYYYKPRAISFGKELADYYTQAGDKEKALAIMQTFFFFTTPDVLARETLKQWFTEIDPVAGTDMYFLSKVKLTGDYYQSSGQPVVLFHRDWNFIANSIPPGKLKKAKNILVDFWYMGCQPCIEEIPVLNKLADSLQNNDDIVFISINTDFLHSNGTENSVKDFANKHGIRFPVLYDNTKTNYQKTLQVSEYPSKFIFSTQGNLVSKKDKGTISLQTFYDFINYVRDL